MFAHVIIAVEVKHVGDQVKRILVVLYFGVQTCEVEAVGKVFFVDLAKVLVPARGYELFE